MRTGGSEPDKKTAGKQTVQSDYVVNSQLEVSGTGDRKTGGGEKQMPEIGKQDSK